MQAFMLFGDMRDAIGAEALAGIWGKAPRTIYRWGADSHCEDRTVDPISRLIDSCRAIKDGGHADVVDRVLGTIAGSLGYDVSPRADSSRGHAAEVLDLMAAVGELVDAYRDAIDDGVIDDNDRAGLESRLARLLREAAEFRAAITEVAA